LSKISISTSAGTRDLEYEIALFGVPMVVVVMKREEALVETSTAITQPRADDARLHLVVHKTISDHCTRVTPHDEVTIYIPMYLRKCQSCSLGVKPAGAGAALFHVANKRRSLQREQAAERWPYQLCLAKRACMGINKKTKPPLFIANTLFVADVHQKNKRTT
jgi:hypothetical protein